MRESIFHLGFYDYRRRGKGRKGVRGKGKRRETGKREGWGMREEERREMGKENLREKGKSSILFSTELNEISQGHCPWIKKTSHI